MMNASRPLPLTMILPSWEWFSSVRQCDSGLSVFGLDLKSCFIHTLKTIVGNIDLEVPSPKLMSATEYNCLLVGYLLQQDNGQVGHDDIELLSEVSTYFYTELITFLSSSTIPIITLSKMKVKGWCGDDLIVIVPVVEGENG